MDADLQDPPEVVETMIARWREGFEIVYAKRSRRDGETAFKRLTAKLFYGLLARFSSVAIPTEVGDFRLVDRAVLEAFRAMPERDRFVRGMFAWLGFRHTFVEFERPPRAAGETKYPIWKMARLAVSGFVGFSDAPLLLAVWIGAVVSGLGLAYGLFVVGSWARGASRRWLGIDYRSGHRALRHEHAAHRLRRSLRRSYPFRGEGPAALHRRGSARVRCGGGAAERATGVPRSPDTSGAQSSHGASIRMITVFDDCAQRYSDEVQSSIDFSGLRHDFFFEAKAGVLERILRDHFGAGKPATTLDVGCGIGLLHSRLAALCREARCSRLLCRQHRAGQASESGCRLLRDRRIPALPRRDIRPGIGRVCVHHVPPGDWPAFVGEMHRVTRKGGLTCVIEHNPLNPFTRLAVSRCSFDADAVLLRAGRTGGSSSRPADRRTRNSS